MGSNKQLFNDYQNSDEIRFFENKYDATIAKQVFSLQSSSQMVSTSGI